MHGKTDMIHHDDRGLYEGLPNPFEATRYHSLVIQPDTLSDEFEVAAWSNAPDGTREIMGIRHKRLAGVRRAVSSGEFPDRLRDDHPGAVPGGHERLRRKIHHGDTEIAEEARKLLSFDYENRENRGLRGGSNCLFEMRPQTVRQLARRWRPPWLIENAGKSG